MTQCLCALAGSRSIPRAPGSSCKDASAPGEVTTCEPLIDRPAQRVVERAGFIASARPELAMCFFARGQNSGWVRSRHWLLGEDAAPGIAVGGILKAPLAILGHRLPHPSMATALNRQLLAQALSSKVLLDFDFLSCGNIKGPIERLPIRSHQLNIVISRRHICPVMV